MELDDFTFKLADGTELTVSAEVTEDDTIVGLTFPMGCRLATSLFEAYTRTDEIEAAAVERYRQRMAEIALERRAAGVAGERSA